MGNQVLSSIENNFTKGLVTEFTGLNFPENAATDCDNVEFTLVGDVLRREGIDYETHYALTSVDRTNNAVATYKWHNAGGSGSVQVLAVQTGGTIRFWNSSVSTIASPLSNHLLSSTVTISNFTASGGTFDSSLECEFASGNGYLFIYHPNCEPIYCTYNAGTITANQITVQIRDFIGVVDNLPANTRPTTLSTEHNYNLVNQGWVSGNPWSAVSTSSILVGLGSKTFTVAAALGATVGSEVTIINTAAPTSIGGMPQNSPIMSGNITAYAGTSMTINVTSGASGYFGQTGASWLLVPRNTAYLTTWNTAVGGYPSNADVWWYFKNSSGVFDPATTLANVSIGAGLGPRGHFILDAFSQQRDVVSSLAITDIQTTVRPRTGCWFQGRAWYTGVDAQQPATGDANYYSWTESIYFSQVVHTVDDLGHCYQVNDPTSENLFDLLPTDGGIIQIQDCGSIYKLFPIQNGLLVFAANGIWFITGSQGIGFTANDYTITKISSVQSISGTSFVNVQGLPYFWNEEGIYSVTPSQQGGLQVEPITVGTILTFYDSIPAQSKRYVRGDYHPIDYVIQWIYRDETASTTTARYEFNKILNFNTYNKAFYPYTVDSAVTINGISYVTYPGSVTSPDPSFKYVTTYTGSMTFADIHDTDFVDFASGITDGDDYESYFITGYKLHGQGQRRFQLPYIYVFSRADDPTSYKIQGLWDYATSGNSGRWSTSQLVNNWSPNFGMIVRRHKVRGQGLVLQLKIKSVSGQPFDIMGWSCYETQNTGV